MLFLSLFNGLTGFYNPLNSIVKSKILVERYRALLMNIFRIPLNTYVIVVLLFLKYMNPFHIAIIAGTLAYIATGIGLFLCIYIIKYGKKEKGMKDDDIIDSLISDLGKPKFKSTIHTEDPMPEEEDNNQI